MPFVFFVLFCTPLRYKRKPEPTLKGVDPEEKEEEEVSSNESNQVAADPLRKWKMMLAVLLYGTCDTTQLAYTTYSPTIWQFMDIQLSASESARISSVMTATNTIGRLITGFISLKLKPDTILMYHYAIIIISGLVLFFGQNNLTIIYIATGALGKWIL